MPFDSQIVLIVIYAFITPPKDARRVNPHFFTVLCGNSLGTQNQKSTDIFDFFEFKNG